VSEFTKGTLFLRQERERVEAKLREVELDYRLIELNENWAAFFFADDELVNPQTVEQLLEVSKAAPLLYFRNFSDHGWAYSIYDGGREVAGMDIEYELEAYFAVKLAEERYPDVEFRHLIFGMEPYQGVWQSLEEEAATEVEFQRQLVGLYANAKVECFQRFGLSDEIITELQNLISPAYINGENSRWEQVELFKGLLGIEEMEYLRFERLEESE